MNNEDRIYPPVAGKVQRIAVSTSAANTPIIASLAGSGWLRIKAVGADVDFYFGLHSDTSPTKDQTGSGPGIGYTLVAGQAEDFWNPGSPYTDICWDASAAGFLVIMRSGPDRVKDG